MTAVWSAEQILAYCRAQRPAPYAVACGMRFRSADGYWSAVGHNYIVTSADTMTVRYCLNEGNVRPEPAGMMSRHYFDQAIGNGALLPAHLNVG